MNSASAIDIGRSATRRETRWRYWRGELKGSEYAWALAFIVPYVAVFLVFVAYPVIYGLWMGSAASLYRELFSDPIYQSTADAAARERLIAQYDPALSEPEWALGYRWDMVLRGRRATPLDPA